MNGRIEFPFRDAVGNSLLSPDGKIVKPELVIGLNREDHCYINHELDFQIVLFCLKKDTAEYEGIAGQVIEYRDAATGSQWVKVWLHLQLWKIKRGFWRMLWGRFGNRHT